MIPGAGGCLVESDEELVQRTRRGDREAFAGLVERYEQAALLVAGSITHSWHDARDAVQDSFVIAYERLNKLWSPHKFGAWFFQIVRRCALLHVRQRARRARRLISVAAESSCAPEVDGGLSIDVAAMISRLPEQECVVITLKHLNELPVAEVARITGRPVGTVTKQLSRAYLRMRPWLDAER
jgi:RNA polymerase sigma-70 factor (ECF subfamily)